MNATKAIVHVVDDDESFRTALQRVLRLAGYETRAYASAGEFQKTRQVSSQECLVLDVHMPGSGGFELQETLSKSGDSLPIIFLTGHGSIPTSVQAMKAGAVDFLTKPVKTNELLTAVKVALTRSAEAYASRESLRALQELHQKLTPRERQVFEGVVAGKLNKEIAAELGTTERTIKAHRANVMEKMRAQSLAQLVHLADSLHRQSQPAAFRAQA
jgi:two-component system, LuxR family, response regulator FixJ